MHISMDGSRRARYNRAMNDNTPTEVEIENLRQARELAGRGLNELVKARSTEAETAIKLAREKIWADLDAKYGERTAAAKEAYQKADREFQDAYIRYARGRLLTDYGSIEVVKWERPRYRSSIAPLVPVLRGQLQVCDHDTKFPGNIPTSAFPIPGEIFIRLYNKTTGEIGMRIVRIERYGPGRLPHSWHPPGVDPNVKKESA